MWMGVLPVTEAPQAAGGVVNGAFPHRRRRGLCAIECSQATLWPFVAQALGFQITTVNFTSNATAGEENQTLGRDYLAFVTRMCRVVKSNTPVHVVFGNWDCFRAKGADYWAQTRIPHVLSDVAAAAWQVPQGWVFQRCSFDHSKLGGLSDSSFTLGVLAPAGQVRSYPEDDQPSPPVQAPSALLNVLNSTVYAEALEDRELCKALDQPKPPGSRPSYLRRHLDPRGLVSLDTVADVKVAAPCVFQKTGWCSRKLKLEELSCVYDVPLLVQEALTVDDAIGKQILMEFCRGSTPGKVLHLGADFLLSSFFRGGFGTCDDDAQVHGKLQEQLSHLARIREAASIAAQQDSRGDTLEEVLQLGVKQDGQKADDAEIPTHLWDAMWMWSRTVDQRDSMKDWWGQPHELDKESGLPRWRWSLGVLREKLLILRWKRNVTRSFCTYAQKFSRHQKRKKYLWWSKSENRYVWDHCGKANYREDWKALRKTEKLQSIMESGREAVERASQTSWWDWDEGSSLLFWRWPESHVRWAREGQPHFITGRLPKFKEAQQKASSPEAQVLMTAKVNKVRRRRYIII